MSAVPFIFFYLILPAWLLAVLWLIGELWTCRKHPVADVELGDDAPVCCDEHLLERLWQAS